MRTFRLPTPPDMAKTCTYGEVTTYQIEVVESVIRTRFFYHDRMSGRFLESSELPYRDAALHLIFAAAFVEAVRSDKSAPYRISAHSVNGKYSEQGALGRLYNKVTPAFQLAKHGTFGLASPAAALFVQAVRMTGLDIEMNANGNQSVSDEELANSFAQTIRDLVHSSPFKNQLSRLTRRTDERQLQLVQRLNQIALAAPKLLAFDMTAQYQPEHRTALNRHEAESERDQFIKHLQANLSTSTDYLGIYFVERLQETGYRTRVRLLCRHDAFPNQLLTSATQAWNLATNNKGVVFHDAVSLKTLAEARDDALFELAVQGIFGGCDTEPPDKSFGMFPKAGASQVKSQPAATPEH